eukprot:9209113-Pyramimonas_sp.AAC.1
MARPRWDRRDFAHGMSIRAKLQAWRGLMHAVNFEILGTWAEVVFDKVRKDRNEEVLSVRGATRGSG